MIYDRLSVGLLGLLATEEADATNAQIARYVLAHAHELGDLAIFDKVCAYGFLKAQAAALDLQVDMLMQGKYISTCTSPTDQLDRIARACADELVIVFSYTGSYFDARDLRESLARSDRPKIWMVCGSGRPLPPFVADRLLFSSDQSRFGHPYQLEYVAGLIAQEYAASR